MALLEISAWKRDDYDAKTSPSDTTRAGVDRHAKRAPSSPSPTAQGRATRHARSTSSCSFGIVSRVRDVHAHKGI